MVLFCMTPLPAMTSLPLTPPHGFITNLLTLVRITMYMYMACFSDNMQLLGETIQHHWITTDPETKQSTWYNGKIFQHYFMIIRVLHG
jgi:hypothetical protein